MLQSSIYFRILLQVLPRLLTIMLVLSAGVSFGTRASHAATAAFVPNQVIVKLNPASTATIATINAIYGTTIIKPIVGIVAAYLLQVGAGSTVEIVLARMAGDLRLLYAEPNFLSNAPEGIGRGAWAWGGPSPSPLASQYAPTLLNLSAAHAITRGAGRVVAVLDTGFQLTHPQLTNRLTTARYDFVDNDANPNNILDGNGDGQADFLSGHGTHVAGIIAQAAPEAKIMLLRVLDTNGVGNSVWVAEAVQYAALNGANVINLSLGAPVQSSLLQEAIYIANREHNVVVVAAAGNASSSKRTFPAGINSSVIAVSAVGANSKKADFANFGSWVDIAAPGDSIYSAYPTNGYAWWSGTSMAAPWISGQAALLLSKCPGLKPNKVLDKIVANAKPLAGGLGAGLPDVAKSLQAPCDKKALAAAAADQAVTENTETSVVDQEVDEGEWLGESEGFTYGQIDALPANFPTDTAGEWIIGGGRYLVTAATLVTNAAGEVVAGEQAAGEFVVGQGALVKSYVAENGQQVAVAIQGITLNHTIYLPTVQRQD